MESLQEKPLPADRERATQARAASSAVSLSNSSTPTVTNKMDLAAFDGSFAPLVRPQAVRLTPWYRRRDYFVGQWFEPALWRSAVSAWNCRCRFDSLRHGSETQLNA
jgi:hypothetical protein